PDHDSAGRTAGTGPLEPHRVSTTLSDDRVPSTIIEIDASRKKSPAEASCVVSHQPPPAMKISRAVCASTGPSTFAAPCDEKYIDDARPMKAYIGAAVDRY